MGNDTINETENGTRVWAAYLSRVSFRPFAPRVSAFTCDFYECSLTFAYLALEFQNCTKKCKIALRAHSVRSGASTSGTRGPPRELRTCDSFLSQTLVAQIQPVGISLNVCLPFLNETCRHKHS